MERLGGLIRIRARCSAGGKARGRSPEPLRVSAILHNFLPYLRALVLLVCSSGVVAAQIDSTPQEGIGRYGAPVRNELSGPGLLYFQNQGLCTICHYFRGRCDMVSIFSATSEAGVPEGLREEKIAQLLASEGNRALWEMDRFTINQHWNSKDGKEFAIYDTMRHKLVIMTKAAYRRETKSAPPKP